MMRCFMTLALAVFSICVLSDIALGQDGLSRGHSILLQRGLQIQAHAFPRLEDTGQELGFDLRRWAESNFTTVNLQFNDQTERYLGPAPVIPWARYAAAMIRPEEMPYLPNLVSLQYRDEQDLSNPDLLEAARAWLDNFRNAYPDTLSFTNQYGHQSSPEVLRNYLSIAKPDMVMFDTYPFDGDASGAKRSPTRFYEHMQKYRRLGLGGHDGSGQQPIPYALYTQHFVVASGHAVSDSEMRLNLFAAWAFGYTFAGALVYTRPVGDDYPDGSGAAVLFEGAGDTRPTARFHRMAEINRQSRNLGPALIRLLSTDIRIIPGEYLNPDGGTSRNPLPDGINQWNDDADSYITSITATNLGSTNDGRAGDLLIGYFKPLHESFDGPEHENEIYFMIVNGLTDSSLDAGVRQRVRITFDFETSGITELQRLDRETGTVESVPLVSDGGSRYHLDLDLDGGAGDLFKFNTGAPFVR